MSNFQIPKFNTFIIPLILTVNIDKCLDSLYKNTEKNSFYVYIIDMSVRGIDSTALRNKYENLMVIRSPKTEVHHTGNLGFAQATNLGISLVQTPYFTMLNDDVEFINNKWWQGILDAFDKIAVESPDRPAMMVNPASIRLADWSVGRPDGEDFDIIPYKEEYTEEDWQHLVNDEHYINQYLTIKPDSSIDGVCMYCTVVDTKKFLEVGFLDEHYFPGSGEDYDYSCLAYMHGYRCIATTKSWVFHHWSSTFRALRAEKEEVKSLQIPELNWNQNHEKWGTRFDIWGIRCSKCPKDTAERMVVGENKKEAHCPIHPEETYTMPESVTMPL